jgi:hypothetical protein
LWHDTASSAIDLNPIGFLASSGQGAFGDNQVGWAASIFKDRFVEYHSHALLWHGSPNDFVDLHQYLANLPITLTDSYANGIDANGNIVGYGFDGNDLPHAILWTPVPEPHSAQALFFGMMGLRMAAYRKRVSRCAVSSRPLSQREDNQPERQRNQRRGD